MGKRILDHGKCLYDTGTVFMNAASQSYEIGIAFFPLITAIRKRHVYGLHSVL